MEKEGESSSESPTISELVSPEIDKTFEIVPVRQVASSKKIDETENAKAKGPESEIESIQHRMEDLQVAPATHQRNIQVVQAEVHPVPSRISIMRSAPVPVSTGKRKSERSFDLYEDPQPSTSKSWNEPQPGPSGDYSSGHLFDELVYYKSDLQKRCKLTPIKLNFDDVISQNDSVSSYDDLKSELHDMEDEQSLQFSYSPSSIIESVSSRADGETWVTSNMELNAIPLSYTPVDEDLTHSTNIPPQISSTADEEPWVSPNMELTTVSVSLSDEVEEHSNRFYKTKDPMSSMSPTEDGEPWVSPNMELTTVSVSLSDEVENTNQYCKTSDPMSSTADGEPWVSPNMELTSVSVSYSDEVQNYNQSGETEDLTNSGNSRADAELWDCPTVTLTTATVSYPDSKNSNQSSAKEPASSGNSRADAELWDCPTVTLTAATVSYPDSKNSNQSSRTKGPVMSSRSSEKPEKSSNFAVVSASLSCPDVGRGDSRYDEAKKQTKSSKSDGKLRMRTPLANTSDSVSCPDVVEHRPRGSDDAEKHIDSKSSRAHTWLSPPMAMTSVTLSCPEMGKILGRSSGGQEHNMSSRKNGKPRMGLKLVLTEISLSLHNCGISNRSNESKYQTRSLCFGAYDEPWMTSKLAMTSVSEYEFGYNSSYSSDDLVEDESITTLELDSWSDERSLVIKNEEEPEFLTSNVKPIDVKIQ